jgi:hypothetical protein
MKLLQFDRIAELPFCNAPDVAGHCLAWYSRASGCRSAIVVHDRLATRAAPEVAS